MQVRGTEVLTAIYSEDTFNAVPATPDGKRIYPTSFSLKTQQARTPSNTLAGTRARREGFLDNETVTGTLQAEIAPEWFGLILKHAIGTVTTTGAGPYTHTFAIGALPAGILFEVDHSATITGSGRYLRHSGSRINSLVMDFAQNGPATFSADILGAHTAPYAAPLDATITDYGHNGFSGFEALITEGGSTLAVCKSIKVTINNNLDGDGYVIGGGGQRVQMAEGYVDVMASGSFLFTDAALMNKALAGTETSLVITLTRGSGAGTAGNEKLTITIPQGKYDKTNPEITGPAGVLVDLSLGAYLKGSTLPIAAELKNALSTL